MAGNKAVFQDAIKKGHNAAWDRKWSVAIAEYGRAAREFPEDASVHLSLAHVQEANGQVENALNECQIAAKLLPHDPQPLMLVAGLQEKLGRLSEAAGTFLAVAELHVAQKSNGKAVDAWQRAAALEPDRTDVHERLAQVYQEGEQNSLAAKECVALARIYRRRGDLAKSGKAIQRALELDPSNSAALAMSEGLAEKKEEPQEIEPPSGPVDRAKQEALSRLAETLLEEKPSDSRRPSIGRRPEGEPPADSAEIDALIARAVDAQSNNRTAEAIETYRALIDSGVSRLEVKLNLGLLYVEQGQYDDAIELLNQTVGEPDYALASHFALGQCCRSLGKIDAALEHFIQVTKIVDLSSIDREHADELISVYEKLAESYVAKGDKDQAEAFTKSLEEFMSGKGWEDKVRELHQHLEKLREEGTQLSLAEAIDVPGGAEVLHALALSQEYLKRGKFEAASAECYHAIELAPYYLPSHVRLAEILAQSGRQQEAREKMLLLAEVAESRGDTDRAEEFYRNLLESAPDEFELRMKLIDLLQRQEGRISNALDEYVALGKAYTRQGIHDKAASTFADAIQAASRAGTAGPILLELRQYLAEARMLQQDYAGALAAYQDLRQHAPGDERVQVRIVELQFRLGQGSAAQKDLEQLIARYGAKGEWRKAMAMLEGLVQITPKESSVWAWLAQCYMSGGDVHMAIHALDTLGDLLLSEGRKQAAAATIRQIIALGPPNVEEYKSLLQQIGT